MNSTTSEEETSALAVLRKHEKTSMLPVETLSTDSRAHCIRDAKRLRVLDCQIWKFKHQIHSTSPSYRKGQETTGFLKRVIGVLAMLLREAPEDGSDFIWNCTPPQAAILPHTDFYLTAPALGPLTPWSPTGSLYTPFPVLAGLFPQVSACCTQVHRDFSPFSSHKVKL